MPKPTETFLKEYQRLQEERIAAFKEYADDVKSGVFPETRNLVAMDAAEFKEAVEAIEGKHKA
jgi:3-methyl-2-oxobutanoate hydroxymethyltransferase